MVAGSNPVTPTEENRKSSSKDGDFFRSSAILSATAVMQVHRGVEESVSHP